MFEFQQFIADRDEEKRSFSYKTKFNTIKSNLKESISRKVQKPFDSGFEIFRIGNQAVCDMNFQLLDQDIDEFCQKLLHNMLIRDTLAKRAEIIQKDIDYKEYYNKFNTIKGMLKDKMKNEQNEFRKQCEQEIEAKKNEIEMKSDLLRQYKDRIKERESDINEARNYIDKYNLAMENEDILRKIDEVQYVINERKRETQTKSYSFSEIVDEAPKIPKKVSIANPSNPWPSFFEKTENIKDSNLNQQLKKPMTPTDLPKARSIMQTPAFKTRF